MRKMLAAVLHAVDQFRIEECPIPEPGPCDVLVKVRACGFCATDFKAIRGKRCNVSFPFIPGHEPSGVVAAVGSGVSHVKEGDAVIIQPSGFCGLCEPCRMGMTHYCDRAYTTGGDGPEDVRPGSFAEYVLTGANTLFHKPASLSFAAACQTEPLSGAWKGLIQMSEMKVGDDVVVIRTGPIEAVRLMVLLLRRGTRCNIFGITTHETFELDGGLMHFLEARMDASFGTTPLAMQQAIRLMERGLVQPEQVISHRFPLQQMDEAIEVMGSACRNKIIIESKDA